MASNIILNSLQDGRQVGFSPHQNNVIGSAPDMEWNFDGIEYDPMWPNDYEKVVKGRGLIPQDLNFSS